MSYQQTIGYRRGLGAVTPTQAVGQGASLASAALAPTIASSIGLTTAIGAAAAIPIVGAAIAALGFGIEAILQSGCGQPCVVTTAWANQAEAALQQNISEYFAIAAPRPKSVQAAALANFDVIWHSLVQQCNSPALGDPGQRCITDRQAGACKWHQTTTPPWGTPQQGQCWNWFNGYRDPIANDPDVVSDTALGLPASLVGSSSSSSIIPLAIAAAALVGFLVVK